MARVLDGIIALDHLGCAACPACRVFDHSIESCFAIAAISKVDDTHGSDEVGHHFDHRLVDALVSSVEDVREGDDGHLHSGARGEG